MKIVSTVQSHVLARNALKYSGIELIITNENPHNAYIRHKPSIMISLQNMERLSKKYMECHWLYPDAQFPGINYNEEIMFDPFVKLKNVEKKHNRKYVIVNLDKNNKLFVQKMKSEYDLDIYGYGYGPNQKDIPKNKTLYEIYAEYDHPIVNDPIEILTCHYLGLNPIIRTTDGCTLYVDKDNVNNHNAFDVFGKILEPVDMNLSKTLLEKKEEYYG